MAKSEKNQKLIISRRDFIRAAAAGSLGVFLGGALVGCQSSPPPPQSAPSAPSAPPPAGAATAQPAAAPTQAPKVGGILKIGLGTDPVTLDPHASGDNEASALYLHIYDPLFRFDDQANLKPTLAESVEPSPDGLTWTVTLRKNVKFQDGSPFNADAVKKAFERHADPKAKRDNAVLPAFQSIEAVNENTVKFVTKEKYAPFRTMLAHQTTGIPSAAAVAKSGEDLTNNPVGAGAFKFKDRVRGDSVTLVQNPDYWGGKPYLEQLVWKSVKEDTTRILMLEAGDLDIAFRVPPTDLERVKNNPDLKLMVAESQRVMMFIFNVARKPFDNLKIRQALNYGVDKDSIIKTVLKGSAIKLDSPIQPKLWGYTKVGSYDYNVDKAKQMLKEAGAEGIPVKMIASQGKEPFDRQVAEAVHGQLLALGLKAELQVMGDFAAYRTAQGKGDFDLALDAIGIGDSDPNKPFSEMLEGKYVGAPGTRNFTNYKNPALDKLLEAGRSTMGEAERKKIYADIQKLVWDDAPWIFLHANNMYYGVRKNVMGVILPANDKIDLRFAWKA